MSWRHGSGRKEGGGGRPRSRASREERATEKLALAHELLADGADVPALEAAGEAVWFDPRRPDGWLVLGEIHLRHDRVREARGSFDRARRGAARRDGDGEESAAMLEALAGLARCDLLSGSLEQSVGSLRKVLEVDPSDPLGLRQLLAEVQLMLGQADACLSTLEKLTTPLPDGHVVAGFAHLERSDLAAATFRFRSALLGNPYLPACLVGEDPPDHGIVHGADEAGPAFARDLADRIAPWIASRPDRLDTFSRIATTPTVQEEVGELIELARALNHEADPEIRQRLATRLGDLRHPGRIHAGVDTVITEASS